MGISLATIAVLVGARTYRRLGSGSSRSQSATAAANVTNTAESIDGSNRTQSRTPTTPYSRPFSSMVRDSPAR